MIAFLIILALLVISQIILWRRPIDKNKRSFTVVKAGSVNKVTPDSIVAEDLFERKYIFEKKEVDPKDFDIYFVHGDSMIPNGIGPDDAIFVERLIGENKLGLAKDKIIVFHIESKNNTLTAEFKLRKLIGYITDKDNLDDWMDSNNIPVEAKNVFLDKFNACLDKYKNNNESNIILSSSTYVDGKLSYSFHPIEYLEGVVQYILPKTSI